jgi:predicted HicB family RNase H-like nuclease
MMNLDSLNESQRRVYEAAVDVFQAGITAAEFSQQFFGPAGMLGKLCKSKQQRKALAQSELYKCLQEQLAELRSREVETFSREVESLSGRLTVKVAKSLHGALRQEATEEGVSLSELIRLKLALPYALTAGVLSRGGGRRQKEKAV